MAKNDIGQTVTNESALLEKALARAARRSEVRGDVAQPDSDPRGRVFPGNMPGPGSAASNTKTTKRSGSARRKVSPFTVVVGLLLTAVASVLYISNVIAVSRLAAEVGELEVQYQTVLNEQEMIRAQIARLSGLERIRRIAEEEYGMQYSEAVPGWLTVDPARVEELYDLSQKAGSANAQ